MRNACIVYNCIFLADTLMLILILITNSRKVIMHHFHSRNQVIFLMTGKLLFLIALEIISSLKQLLIGSFQ